MPKEPSYKKHGMDVFLRELNRLIPVRLKGKPRDMDRHLAIQAEKGISLGIIIDPKWYRSDRAIRLEFCMSGTGEFFEIKTNQYIKYGSLDYSWIMHRRRSYRHKDIKVLSIFNLGTQMARKAVKYENSLRREYNPNFVRGLYQTELECHARAMKKVQDVERHDKLAKEAYQKRRKAIRYVIIQQLEEYNAWARPILEHRAKMPRQRPLDVDLCECEYRGWNHTFSVEDLIPK